MSAGGLLLSLAVLVSLGVLGWLLFALARSIQVERTPGRSVWREFGLGLGLMVLFLASWTAQAVAEWQTYTDDQRRQGAATELGDFAAHFAQSTLENWQSEFLQLFSFVVLASLYIHKGSAESKDGEEKLEAALRRIEERLGTAPPTSPTDAGNEWRLAETPLESEDRARRDAPSR